MKIYKGRAVIAAITTFLLEVAIRYQDGVQ